MTTQLPKEEVLRLAEEVEIKSYLGYVYFPKSSVYVAPEELAKLIELVRKEAIAETYAKCMKITAKSPKNTWGYSTCCVNAVGKVWRELEQAKFADLLSELKQSEGENDE